MDENADGAAGRELLCAQLATTDESLKFLFFLVLSVLLSFWSVALQRRQLVDTISGNNQAVTHSVFPIKRSASALVVGALGFFLSLSLRTCKTAAAGDDCVAQHSADMNVWASLLVFAAALIRLYDLNFVERCKQPLLLSEDTLPA